MTMQLEEVRKEDDIYYQGPFWIVSDSQVNINKGKFQIIGEKIPVDFQGNYLNGLTGKKGSTSHKVLWNEYKNAFNQVDFNYFPRGRVRIVSGEVFIHLNSKVNNPKVVNSVIQFYELNKLSSSVNIEEDDLLQGSHYDFLLP